jgi:hypothetical protein
MAQGVVRISHASSGDSILEHRSYDYNGNLVPDARYRYLIAGRAAQHTNNYGPQEREALGPAALRVGERDHAAMGLAHRRRPGHLMGILDLGLRPLGVVPQQHGRDDHRRAQRAAPAERDRRQSPQPVQVRSG